MGNVMRIFKRDVLRLLKAPAALVVIIVLMVLPSLYTWFNVYGFMDPYAHTGNLRVCVVNEDEGATHALTGDLRLGDEIVIQLDSNDELGWAFVDRETAMEEVDSGRAYAAFVIPSDFSKDFTTILTGDFKQPKLEYYVNEKAGAVSPKITDTGATTLEETINSTFVGVVSKTVSTTIGDKINTSKAQLDTAQGAIASQLSSAHDSIGAARSSLRQLSGASTEAIDKANAAKASLEDSKKDIALLSDQLKQTSDLTVIVQNKVNAFAGELLPALGQSNDLASQAASKTNTTIASSAASIITAQGDVNAAIASGRATVEQNKLVIKELQALVDAMPEGTSKDNAASILAALKDSNDNLESTLDSLEIISKDTAETAAAVSDASDHVNTAMQGTLAAESDYRNTITTSTLPAINTGLSQIAGSTGTLSGVVAKQTLLVDQASLVLDQLISTLSTTTDALTQTDALLSGMESDLNTVQTDFLALMGSETLQKIFESSIDPQKISDFMQSPTELKTEKIYPLNAYGSAMAPLFTNLTLWIGVFMLMVILKLEVDDEGIKKATITQRYLARWLFFAPIVAMQAIICCTGNLALGVQAVNVPLFYATAVVTSLTYLSIQYALSVTLQHVGKGICIILVFVQIPGATGLYPIEMTTSFFQAVYPIFPFTYGINALRETIGGFYGDQYGQMMLVLLLFCVISFLVGLFVRPYLTNLNRLFAKQISESDIFNSEDVHVPSRRYRITQLINALSDRDEYRESLKEREAKFIALYPRLKQGALLFGVVVPLIAMVVFSLNETEKVIVLTAWLVWLAFIVVFLILVEYIYDSFERRRKLEVLSDSELRSLMEKPLSREGVRLPGSGERVAAAAVSSEVSGEAARASSDGGLNQDEESTSDSGKGGGDA